MDRLWKRFVRVRTDDLESVRVERAIKRVRSDLAAHTGIPTKEKENLKGEKENNAVVPEVGSIAEKDIDQLMDLSEFQTEIPDDFEAPEKETGIKEMEQDDIQQHLEGHPSKSNNATEGTATQPDHSDAVEVAPSDDVESPSPIEGPQDVAEPVPETPIAAEPPMSSRLHRSQSAEPDKSHRISRAYTSSVPSQSGAESQTGDESSSSAAPLGKRERRRKKRSASGAGTPKDKEPRKSQRKVVIDDFEMMRVLGKGCAGKVLLVRHKTTQDLFALKAITKRHVLAHQELQHTLTEQAVLKRMAAESRDPFVVKLWWSFHDKENLFLVMVCFFVLGQKPKS